MEWKFKKDVEPQGGSNGFWYDITSGGYIKPVELLDDKEQLDELSKAINIVSSFEQAMIDNELINEF